MHPADLAHLPDEELMLLVANGFVEQPATELFKRHNRALFNFLAWLCEGNLSEAEDLAQKTWVKLMTRCSDYRPGQAAFTSFLFQIGRNAWLDTRRSAYHTTSVALDDAHLQLPDDDLSAEQLAMLGQQQHRVRAALMALPDAQREVVVLRFFAELGIEEIAHVIGEGFETVKSRLRYAFAKLRMSLEAAP
ncbi:sigma-70 family RNA polymerase sigma factor [Xanthomonas prunicola]|uniref:Sigma-70 family RNA polymerase sigma factor n=1 Tax=Xanthomonas prunicola TaxID=2053930 RepID=A0A9Q9J168_9XANT|nr:sigma-70 family RNA polymerase sigma factor [Xanthomonas prunicola]USI99596.1 sigma-70 family RNA polymerase sigma factor [Xanthomonas prunicola]UXA48050.1 sigma-70 family RNA polymerase sigma factor [Xanthomonas prunicola]UXA54112.1 sigma-70 family RNA polymerase sigma factor [Xanthomonas prunicola]UXA56513.1 sigma-70 family RNA polymerase sigma factor [Xanthomonas prunicola]UXA62472.1 sigma-70 family RNA polymerase sigma factor [Xanthomonas prunicola]